MWMFVLCMCGREGEDSAHTPVVKSIFIVTCKVTHYMLHVTCTITCSETRPKNHRHQWLHLMHHQHHHQICRRHHSDGAHLRLWCVSLFCVLSFTLLLWCRHVHLCQLFPLPLYLRPLFCSARLSSSYHVTSGLSLSRCSAYIHVHDLQSFSHTHLCRVVFMSLFNSQSFQFRL